MLTHELEEPGNLNTYLAQALSPLRPLYTFGRSFGAAPRIPREQAVWDFWKDLRLARTRSDRIVKCLNKFKCFLLMRIRL